VKPLPLAELARIVGGQAVGIRDEVATGFALDSREVRPGELFLAIRGAKTDGHDHVPEALAQGAVAALAEREVEGPHVLVPNLVDALARMALHFREKFRGPVVGITGSVGKTITKEFVAASLSPLGKIAQTSGNRNTEYTAPLIWPEMEGDEAAAVVEMGMRGFGQIRHLASFARPTMGLITNIGHSHLELVGSREGIAQAKAELFEALPSDGRAFAFAGDDFLGLLRAQAPCPVETFGFHSGDAQVASYRAESWTRSSATVRVKGHEVEVELPAAGRHLALNAAAALLVASACEVRPEAAAAALSQVKLPGMRMEVLERNGATLVLDAYNAAPTSFLAALETLKELPCAGERMVAMGEMRELGALTEQAHREVGRAIAAAGVRRACFWGESAAWAREECLVAGLAPESFAIAESLEDVRAFVQSARPGDTILIKGSRALEMERVASLKEAEASA
jgi:UDP-N-acetylmuramoyl-tripeptide--D-alanyl-D-alanine ligase